eukprot:1539171-Rhodomonas_salina.1
MEDLPVLRLFAGPLSWPRPWSLAQAATEPECTGPLVPVSYPGTAMARAGQGNSTDQYVLHTLSDWQDE